MDFQGLEQGGRELYLSVLSPLGYSRDKTAGDRL